MNAKKARELADKTSKFDVIDNIIETAAIGGQYKCAVPFNLSYSEREHYENLGYKITAWGGVLFINW